MRRRLLLLASIAAAALTSVGIAVGVPGDVTPPAFDSTPDVTTEATGPAGAAVAFSVTATDPAEPAPGPSDPVTVTCTPASGDTFPLGSTTVSCTATDAEGNAAVGTDGAGQFDVAVVDTTPPAISVPAGLTVQPTGPEGATVGFDASAADLVSGTVPVSCTPASGSVFPLGPTLVTCTATDGAGNEASVSFTVSVQDGEAPVVTVPDSRTVEANGPGGAIVHYEAPTAVDTVEGPIAPPDITCTMPSGALFPLGSTLVTCYASDSGGRLGLASFTITVEDTTPPALTVPPSLAIQSTSPVGSDDPRIQSFLASATATDIVDQDVKITNDAPGSFPLGTTSVIFTAEDDSGNTTQKTVAVTITTQPVAPPAGVDTTPPGNVRGVKAIAGNLSVSITWRRPAAPDFDHVTITRTPGSGSASESVVYVGRATRFVARGLEDGVEYRFVIAAYDEAGNRAAGVAVITLAQRQNLLAPLNGATIDAPRRFAWRAVAAADYYNIQFWRNGKKLSAWPVRPRFLLRRSWRFEGKLHRLAPGTWHVYVWPGFGDKDDARYGDLHVDATFVVSRR
jgi:hypothetical protein